MGRWRLRDDYDLPLRGSDKYFSGSKTILECALAYVARGLSVLPCHAVVDGTCTCGRADCGRSAGKHPKTVNGVRDASRDPVTLAKWFADTHAPVNLAIATGEPSGTWVMDVDDMARWPRSNLSTAQLPPTPVVVTGSGTRHYYWRWTDALADMKNAVKFAGALDVRTTGGIVVVPPSIHRSGSEYRWLVSPDDVPLADAPYGCSISPPSAARR